METLLEKLKWAFAHQAIVEGLPIKAEHTNRLAEIAYRLSNEHNANTVLCKPEGSDGARGAAVGNSAAGQSGSGGMYCVSSDALVYGKPCKEWCGDENCWRGGSAKGALPR